MKKTHMESNTGWSLIDQWYDFTFSDAARDPAIFRQQLNNYFLAPNALFRATGQNANESIFWRGIQIPGSNLRRSVSTHFGMLNTYTAEPWCTAPDCAKMSKDLAYQQIRMVATARGKQSPPGIADPYKYVYDVMVKMYEGGDAPPEDIGFNLDANGKVIDPNTGKAFVAKRQYAGLGTAPDVQLSPVLQVGIATALVAAGVLLLSGKSDR